MDDRYEVPVFGDPRTQSPTLPLEESHMPWLVPLVLAVVIAICPFVLAGDASTDSPGIAWDVEAAIANEARTGVVVDGSTRYAGMTAREMLEDAFNRGITEVKGISWLGYEKDQIAEALYAISEDPEFFFADISECTYWTSMSGTVTKVELRYAFDRSELPHAREVFEQRVAEALSWIPQGASDAQKCQAIHDYLVRTVSYDLSTGEVYATEGSADAVLDVVGFVNDITEHTADIADATTTAFALPDTQASEATSEHGRSRNPYTAYGALVDACCVCDGYSDAFQLLLNRAGVACSVVVSDSMAHSWNMVLVDGTWYHVDVTWDDPVPDSGFEGDVSHAYFLVRTEALSVDGHGREDWRVSYVPDGVPSPSDDPEAGAYDYSSEQLYLDVYAGPRPQDHSTDQSNNLGFFETADPKQDE